MSETKTKADAMFTCYAIALLILIGFPCMYSNCALALVQEMRREKKYAAKKYVN